MFGSVSGNGRTPSSLTLSVTRIAKLTAAQLARFPEWIERYTALGLSVEPADWDEAERAICEMYDMAKVARVPVVRVASPMIGAWAAPSAAFVIAKGCGVQGARDLEIYSAVGPAFRSAVEEAVHSAFDGSVHSTGDAAVNSDVYSVVRSAIYSAVHLAVRSAIAEVVDSRVRSVVHSAVYSAVDGEVGAAVDWAVDRITSPRYGGQFGISYAAWATYIRDVLRAKVPIGPYERLASSAGCIWPYRSFCMVCDRPERIERDSDGRPHAEDGMAIRFRDGWGLYRWHGATVPEDVILRPESITVEMIEKQRNAEVRRVMVERYGEARYIMDSGVKAIHSDDYGTLYMKERPFDFPLVIVKVVNSTPDTDGTYRDYFLRCHPELRPMRQDGSLGEPQEMTARAAVASTFGMTADEYAPCDET